MREIIAFIMVPIISLSDKLILPEQNLSICRL